MGRPPIDRTSPKRGFKTCPVCGCRYQGELMRHLDEKVGLDEIERKGRIYGANSTFPEDLAEATRNAVTRCEWRLVENRIHRKIAKLAEDGWCLAGSLGAKVAVLVATTHKNLAQHTTSGLVPMTLHRRHFDPRNDPSAWWIKKWAYPLTQISGWSLRKRAQIITELEGKQEAVDTIEATYRIGGVDAVRELEGGVIPHRCSATRGDVQKAVLRPVPGTYEQPLWCILPEGHDPAIAHKDTKTGVLWTKDWVTTTPNRVVADDDDDLDLPGLADDDLDLAGLFRPRASTKQPR